MGTLQAGVVYTSSSTVYNPADGGTISIPHRWGDYSYTSLDPCDDMTMWTIPVVVLGTLSTRQRNVLEAKLAVLRRLLEPDPEDDRSLGQRYED